MIKTAFNVNNDFANQTLYSIFFDFLMMRFVLNAIVQGITPYIEYIVFGEMFNEDDGDCSCVDRFYKTDLPNKYCFPDLLIFNFNVKVEVLCTYFQNKVCTQVIYVLA